MYRQQFVARSSVSRSEFKMASRLVFAYAGQHPGRMLLTLLSTIAASCVVVWVVSGYDVLTQDFDGFAEDYMGRYDAYVLPTEVDPQAMFGRGSRPAIDGELAAELRKDPAVAAVDAFFETRASVQRIGEDPDAEGREPGRGRGRGREGRGSNGGPGGPPGFPPFGPQTGSGSVRYMGGYDRSQAYDSSAVFVGVDSSEPPHTLREGRWFDPQASNKFEGVVTHGAAERLRIKLGDQVRAARGRDDDQLVTIVGIVEQPKQLPPPKFMIGLPPSREAALHNSPASAAVYVPMKLAESLSGQAAVTSYIGFTLQPDYPLQAFESKWADRLSKAQPAVEIRTLQQVESKMDEGTSFEGARAQAYSATGISLLASLFIIFSTLSMGVHERIRQFAVLRAVALTKWQVATMIALESLLLGLIGWAGGLLAGWNLLRLSNGLQEASSTSTGSLGFWCIALSGMCALGGSLAAAVMPAWRATEVRPLDAMAPTARTGGARLSWGLAALGLALIAVNPLLVFYVPMADTARYAVSAGIGCVAMAIGFVLITPMAVVLTERWLGPLLARLAGVSPRLLALQLSTNMWRTVGTTIALTLGLGLFVAMQTWGYSMLGPFTPGSWTPDLVVEFSPDGLPDDEIEAVRQTVGVVADECVPLAVKHAKFADDILGFNERASATRQDTTLLVGVDPDMAFGGDDPMFDFEYAEGSPAETIAKLKQGRYCIVPDHFKRDTGLGIGGKFSVVASENPQTVVEYEIAGVVSAPGWHWMTKMGFRRGRAGALMLGDYDQIRADFQTGPIKLFWMNLEEGVAEEDVQKRLLPIGERHFQPRPAASPFSADEASPFAGRWPGFGRPTVAAVNLRSAANVRTEIRARAAGIIWKLSELPLVTLAVTALGVVNTVLSSGRARQWEMGVMRSMGVTRFGLFRLIVAESLLVGLVACVLSLCLGALAGYCGTGVTRYVNIRGGQITPLIIPWAQIFIGFGITLALCFLAALWPAIRTGRTEPLQLLQSGRTAM